MTRPTSSQLHRAKRKKEVEWRDTILQLVDSTLSEALAALDTAEVVLDMDRASHRVNKMIKRAQLRVHISRLVLRDHYDEPDYPE